MTKTLQTLAGTRATEVGFGFLYWLSFLVALEPGNVARAAATGAALAWDQEVLRILGASALGALATPAVMALLRRFPIEGAALRRHLAIHGAAAAAIAFGLIVLSCALAPLAQVGDTRPFLTALPDHLTANWTLLAFSVAGLIAVAQVMRFRQRAEVAAAPAPGEILTAADSRAYLTHVQIKSRGHVSIVDLSTVDWIEAQGNYVALHCGTVTHLVRETLSTFEAKLDPETFVRVHRSCLVRLARVTTVAPRSNGDGLIRLTCGSDVRLSRGYRERLHAVLARRS